MTDWKYKEATEKTIRWSRSWRQTFFTEPDSEFYVNANIQDVLLLEDGAKVFKDAGVITRRMSQVKDDPRVRQLHALLTELIKDWMDEDEMVKSNPEVTP